MLDGYRTAFEDWLGCVAGGRAEPAARAAASVGDGLLERVAAVGTAGHVLDFDDTYTPGLAHLSAPVGPAALVAGAELDASPREMIDAFAAGFEAMGAMTRASHPVLYDRHLHPTAVCGPVGAAVATAALLGLDTDTRDAAVALALLRGAGLLAAFGGDGKALQVGQAAAAGVTAARLAAGGARVDLERAAEGFTAALGGVYAPPADVAAVEQNWIKAWPCCLQTHGPIETALRAREAGVGGPFEVVVHPLARAAAPYDDVADGLQAKFSIPYAVALTLRDGDPTVASFAGVDDAVRAAAAEVRVSTDDGLGHQAAVLLAAGDEVARVETALGSPARPMSAERLAAKVRSLAGRELGGALSAGPRDALAAVWS